MRQSNLSDDPPSTMTAVSDRIGISDHYKFICNSPAAGKRVQIAYLNAHPFVSLHFTSSLTTFTSACIFSLHLIQPQHCLTCAIIETALRWPTLMLIRSVKRTGLSQSSTTTVPSMVTQRNWKQLKRSLTRSTSLSELSMQLSTNGAMSMMMLILRILLLRKCFSISTKNMSSRARSDISKSESKKNIEKSY